MSARILDGQAVAAAIREELRPGVARFAAAHGRPPGLTILLAGNNPASEVYVGSKLKSGGDVGFRTTLERLPASASLDEALAVVDRLNHDEAVDGILVQSPLPEGMGRGAAQRVFDAIDPRKDVDGFTPINAGLLVQNRAVLKACTPAGIMQLFDRSGIALAGRRAVVVGRSDIVGKPMAMMLLHRDCTVTICHSKTPDLAATCAQADILVAAIGRPAFVTRAFVKPGATVIDVGMNPITDRAVAERIFAPGTAKRAAFEKKGSVLVGDVHPDVYEVAGAITPVPGGVGPLTIAMLMHNTLRAAEARVAQE